MDHHLSECGLKLSYLRGQPVIKAIDRQQLFDDLLRGVSPREAAAWAIRPALADYEHLVLAQELATGATIGVLGAHDHQTSKGPFLWLETGFVAAAARGQNLLRRMIALMLLRIVTQGHALMTVATMTGNPIAVHVMQQMATRISDARFAPGPEGTVVDIAAVMMARDVAAALGRCFDYRQAHRPAAVWPDLLRANGNPTRAINAISPMLAMLDLRACSIPWLIADLRSLYCARSEQASPSAGGAAEDSTERAVQL